jgi:hypothetical protein
LNEPCGGVIAERAEHNVQSAGECDALPAGDEQPNAGRGEKRADLRGTGRVVGDDEGAPVAEERAVEGDKFVLLLRD